MLLKTAPFIKPKAFVPSDQIQRMGPTQTLRMVHYDTSLYGVAQTLDADTPLFTDPNRLGKEDLCSLKEAGKFSDGKQFVVFALACQCFFTQLDAPEQGEAPAEELYDLFVYYSRIHVKYQDAEKQILWTDRLPAGGGVYGSTTSTDTFHLTNGEPIANAVFKLGENMVITPQKTFTLTRKWHSRIFNPTVGSNQQDPRTRFNNAIHSQKLVRDYLDGIEGRDVSNG